MKGGFNRFMWFMGFMGFTGFKEFKGARGSDVDRRARARAPNPDRRTPI
jgi:hypothetical protein